MPNVKLPMLADEKTVSGEESRTAPRKEFLGAMVGALGAAAGAMALPVGAAASIPRQDVAHILDRVGPRPEGNHLERMLDDLDRALEKPIEDRHWVMVIDLAKCIGCKACTVSCVAENNLPPGVVYRPVVEEEVGQFPDVRKRFIPRPCMQCDNPPCVPVCPVSATYKRPDGIVAVDYDVCIGCRYCIAACPYNARTADFGEFYGEGLAAGVAAMAGELALQYETRPNFEYGKEWRREPGREESPMGNARKCQFCIHRVENGMLPACVTTCLGGATFFGDYNDREALVHELVGSPRMMRLKEELGTDPQVFYLM
ncbi:MAG: 4Fe-4S dicluster domain-containing protein [Gemmatimonadota bacterium]